MSGAKHRGVLFAASLAQIMIVLDATIIAIALPAAQLDLGFSEADKQWTISAYAITFGALLLVGGRIVERIGVRLAFSIAAVGFALASVLGGFSGSLAILILARVLQGLFAALLGPANLSMVASTFVEPRERSRAFAVFGSTAGAGAALGLLLGGVLTEYLGWRWCLFVNVIFALVCLFSISGASARIDKSPIKRHTDFLGLALGSGALFFLILGVSEVAVRGWSDLLVVGCLILSVLSLLLFAWRLVRARSPIFPPSLLAQSLRRIAYAAVTLVGFSQMASSLYLSYFLQGTLEMSALQTGLALIPLVVALVIAAVISMRLLVLRIGPRFTMALGLAFQAGAFAVLSPMDPTWSYAPWILLGASLLGLGIGFMMALAVSTATDGVPLENSGVASSLTNTAQQVGGAVGVAASTTFAVTRFEELLNNPDSQIPPADWPAWAQSYAYGNGFAALASVYAIAALLLALAGFLHQHRLAPHGKTPPDRQSDTATSDGAQQ